MNEQSDIGILRNAVMHTQPRSLRRSPSTMSPGQSVAAVGGVPASSSPSPAAPRPERDMAHEASRAAAFMQGREDGFREGLAEGTQDGRRRVDEAIATARAEAGAVAELARRGSQVEHEASLARLQSIGAAFQSAAAERLKEFEADAVELAFAAVCKIAGAQAHTREGIEGIVRTAMGALHGAKLLRVRVHPDDLALLVHEGSATPAPAGIEWVADAGVDSGGCMLDADRGSIDARLATQLDRLRVQWSQTLHAPASPAHRPLPA